jgi:hypothetical protein
MKDDYSKPSRNNGMLIQWKPPLALDNSAEGIKINVS